MSLTHDVRHARRLARKSPLFTFAVVATLALCIGANATMFSLVDSVLLQAVPYPEPERLVEVAVVASDSGADMKSFGHDGRTWEELRSRLRLTRLAALSGLVTTANFAYGSNVGTVQVQRVSAGFFAVLGVEPWMGREFTEEEDRPGGPATAVVSHGFWKRVLGETPDAVGSSLLLRGEPHTIVGVLPGGFRASAKPEIWTPLRPSREGEGAGTNYQILGRIREDTSLAQAAAEIEVAGDEILASFRLRTGRGARFALASLREGLTHDFRGALFLSWGAVGAVLLIGSVNLASLLLSRGAARAREIAVRIALGGRPGAIARQLLTETLLLALAGGVAGLFVARLALAGLATAFAQVFPLFGEVTLDLRAVLATALLSVLAALGFGALPAVQAWKLGVRSSLAGGRTVTGGAGGREMPLLMIGQVAAAVPLLVAATLFGRSFLHLWEMEPGFDGTGVVAAKVSLDDARYESADDVNRLFREALENLSESSGIESAAVSLTAPYERWLNIGFEKAGGEDEVRTTALDYVTPDYFRVLGLRLLRGRTFTDSDGADGARVIVVSRAFADRHFRNEEPLGSVLRLAGAEWVIVGVVEDVPQRPSFETAAPLTAEVPSAYVPIAQMDGELLRLVHAWFSPTLLVKTNLPGPRAPTSIQEAIAKVDPLLPLSAVVTFTGLKSEALVLQRLLSVWFAAYAALAATLVAVGLYALAASLVSSRERELCIRTALGATIARTLSLALSPGLRAAGLGLTLGIALSLAASRLMQRHLWGVAAADPWTLAGVALAGIAVAAAASLVPALRVAGLDPARKLREE
jgi:predicted permease